jgi:transposase-like protein
MTSNPKNATKKLAVVQHPNEQHQPVSREEALQRLPAVEVIQQELASAKSVEDFFGREGIFARLFASTIEGLLEAELDDHLGYGRYERRSEEALEDDNSRNGKRYRQLKTSGGQVAVAVPRDRNGTFEPKLLAAQSGATTNELEEKVIHLYAKGNSTREISDTLADLYGVSLSAQAISTITDKVKGLVETWQNRVLADLYAIIYLDAIHLKIRREGKVENVAVYVVLGVDANGYKDVLGHWVGNGAEAANFWLGVLTDLQARGVKDILIACVDGLSGFKEAIGSIYPRTLVQRCVIHQLRNSLKYVTYKDRKAFAADLKKVYTAVNREQAESFLLEASEKWASKYPAALKSWENNWEELTTFFDFGSEIRRLIYTTNSIESYNRQLRRVLKTKGAFPNPEAVRKLLYLANENITEKWTMPIPNWASILNQLSIRFEGRIS